MTKIKGGGESSEMMPRIYLGRIPNRHANENYARDIRTRASEPRVAAIGKSFVDRESVRRDKYPPLSRFVIHNTFASSHSRDNYAPVRMRVYEYACTRARVTR